MRTRPVDRTESTFRRSAWHPTSRSGHDRSVQATLSAHEPSVRGRALIELLAHMNEFEAGLLQRVRTHVPDEDLEILDHMRPTDWIPASRSRAVIDGIIAELGPRATRLWVSLVGARMVRTPLLGGFFDMLVRLGGMSPERFIKSLPRGWGNAYRDWGEPEVVEMGEAHARIEFTAVAPYLFEHRQHWIAVEGVLLGLIDVGNRKGEAELEFDPDAHRVEAHVRW